MIFLRILDFNIFTNFNKEKHNLVYYLFEYFKLKFYNNTIKK